MGGNTTDNSPPFLRVFPCRALQGGRGRVPAGPPWVPFVVPGCWCARGGGVGALLGPEGTGPLSRSLLVSPFFLGGCGVGVVGWGLLSLAVGVLVGASARVLRVSGVDVWRPGGRGVFVNWIVDASI